jgi:hypothetical protein
MCLSARLLALKLGRDHLKGLGQMIRMTLIHLFLLEVALSSPPLNQASCGFLELYFLQAAFPGLFQVP